MSRTPRKARAFRPSLSDSLETRVVPSAVTAFQARQAAIDNLVAHHQTVLQQRQAVLQQRQALFNQRTNFQTQVNFGNPGLAARRQSLLYGGTNVTTARNGANSIAANSVAATTPAAVNMADPASAVLNTTVSANPALTSGGFGFSTTTAQVRGVPIPAVFNNLGTIGGSTALNAGAFGLGNFNLGTTTLSPTLMNTTVTNTNPTVTSPQLNTTVTNTNSIVGTVPGIAVNNFPGSLANMGLNTVTRSLFSIPGAGFIGGGLGPSLLNTGAFNFGNLYANSGAFNFGNLYANTGAFNFGSLYNAYVGSGAIGGAFRPGFGGVAFV